MKHLEKQLKNVLKHKIISGVGEGEKIVLSQQFDRLLFLCSNFVSAGKIKKGLEAYGKKIEIISNARETDDENDKNLLPMIASLNRYLSGQIDGLIFLPCSIIIKFDKDKFQPINIKKEQTIELESLVQKLVEFGYERTSLVTDEGQFALRGDILDIFSPLNEKPIRIEFFDDFVEKISIFDENSMKNLENIDEINIFISKLPMGENNAFDLVGTKIVDEPKKIDEEISMLIHSYTTMSFYNHNNYADFNSILDKADYLFENFELSQPDYFNDKIAQRSYLTDFLALKQDIIDFKNLNQAILLYTGEERFSKSLKNFLVENGFSYKDYNPDKKFVTGNIYVSSLAMPYSFSFLKEGIIAIGCEMLFRSAGSGVSKSRHSVFYLPKLGDYVVHTFHGIGKCIKIERLKIADIEKDYFVIEYKNGDILYLPSEEANTISAYIGSEQEPKLSSLGGGEFARLKERVKKSIKEMAISLVEIYKERQKVKGFAFKRDDFLEKKFADSFGFSETLDQQKAISDIDKDMESDKVMDRLICGDVGFGKTEVALRACFKCAYNGKQVAFLCPTTILSEQHYRTSKKRFDEFGVKVEVINRFKNQVQIKEILRRVENGDVDVLIGTHRILSNDIKFHDLGLLVLDEEQRFGVEHKEKIKDKNRNIDVLTLSATPIPRTLNMSLSGLRDISVIETPPKDRLPIQTYLAEESEQLIKDVLSRELARGGQAFVVYNRVDTIDEFANFIRRLMPNANVGVAHGQMSEKELESVISKLFDGLYNILISTTLIENGIDLPSANTMVVIDADRLGLSQLYQLRGRIGRSDKLSYAYLMYDKDKQLTDEAYKRLEAIKEFSQLGSGFKIAMRDLEIRGAGNIFGKEQHGHIAKVGYDMYVKLLDEEVKEIKGEKINKLSDVKLEISLSAFINENYIEDSEQRIIYYTRISEINSEQELKNTLSSLEDGYGQVPKEIENLCYMAYLRNLASHFDVEKIRINKGECLIQLIKKEEILDKRLGEILSDFNAKLAFDKNVKIKFDKDDNILKQVKKLISFFEKALNGTNN